MTSRRGFLSLLVAAPFAAPAMVKAVAAERYSGVAGSVARYVPNYGGAIDSVSAVSRLELTMDTMKLRASLDEMVRVARIAMQPTVASGEDDPHDPVPDYFC